VEGVAVTDEHLKDTTTSPIKPSDMVMDDLENQNLGAKRALNDDFDMVEDRMEIG
jgi:hypothetical protein